MSALIAGFGNVFFSDDGYGPAVVRRLADVPLPPDVYARDFGISGMYLALEMLKPYDLIILVDAIAREGKAGTLYMIEPDSLGDPVLPDAHAMDVRGVLALHAQLRRDLKLRGAPKILIVGCVPETTAEGMALSAAVEAALPASVTLVRKALERHSDAHDRTALARS